MSRLRSIAQTVSVGSVSRPLRTVAIALVLTIVSLVAIAGFQADGSSDLLVDDSSEVGAATLAQESTFGGEPIVVLVEGRLLDDILSPESLRTLQALEGQIAGLDGVKAVFGPGTFLSQTVNQVFKVFTDEIGPPLVRANREADQAYEAAIAGGVSPDRAQELAEQARTESLGPLQAEFEGLQARFGYIGIPSIENRNFVAQLILGTRNEPKEIFEWLFPDAASALIIIRPSGSLSDAEVGQLGERIEQAVAEAPLGGLTTTIAGAPLVATSISEEISTELLILVPIVFLLIGVVLLLSLRSWLAALRCLAIAAFAVLLTTALSRLLGLGLSPATVAALPVILGLAVDFAVQLVARAEALRAGGEGRTASAHAAITGLAPTLGLAALAMAGGFMVLMLSDIPLVDRLGQTLALGTAVSLAVVLTLGGALLALGSRDERPATTPSLPAVFGRARLGVPVLAVVGTLAMAGIALAGGSEVESDLQELAPDGLEQLERAKEVQDKLGTSGQLRIAIAAEDVTDPELLVWLAEAQDEIAGVDERLTPGPSLAQLLLVGTGGQPPSRDDVDRLLRLVPGYFVSGVVSPGRTQAELSFGVPLVPVAEQVEIIDKIEPVLESAPEGATAVPAGLVASAATGVEDLEGQRPWLLLVALGVVFTIVAAIRRDPVVAAIVVLPALLAAGVSALVLLISGLKLSPLSAGLEPLVLAVGTEFGLLLEARYREARGRGADPERAGRQAVSSVGAAVAVSAMAVAAGFAALVFSRLSILQEFGLLVGLELGLCFLAAVTVVPWFCAEAERRGIGERFRLRAGKATG